MPTLHPWRFLAFLLLFAGCSRAPEYDVMIRNGTLYDGSGQAPIVGDVGIKGDTIVAIGSLKEVT